jgi:hypothetical protein
MNGMLLKWVIFLVGAIIAGSTITSAIKTFVVPRNVPSRLTRLVFVGIRRLIDLRLRWEHTFEAKDRILAFYAPISLLALLPTWYALVFLGYLLMFWGSGTITWYEAFRESGSSLFTLGFSTPDGFIPLILSYSEAIIGLILVALLIAYLPTMYSAFKQRETAVTLLEVRAGDPPTAIEMIKRFQRLHGLDSLKEQWKTWESWFADIEESHTSLAALVFFRSPQPTHSWINAAGTVLDAASLTLSSIDIPFDPMAALCIRAGYISLRRIADTFHISYKENVTWQDPISISRVEFEAALSELAMAGVPVKADHEQAWRDFAGWRANYDTALVALTRIVNAPASHWMNK